VLVVAVVEIVGYYVCSYKSPNGKIRCLEKTAPRILSYIHTHLSNPLHHVTYTKCGKQRISTSFHVLVNICSFADAYDDGYSHYVVGVSVVASVTTAVTVCLADGQHFESHGIRPEFINLIEALKRRYWPMRNCSSNSGRSAALFVYSLLCMRP